MVAEIDCNSFSYVCSNKFKAKSFPNFVRLLKGLPKGIHPDFDYNGFKNRVEELKDLKMNELCEKFPIEKQKYPALVLHLNKSKAECCKVIDEIVKYDVTLTPSIFCQHKAPEEKLEVYTNEYTKFQMEANLTIPNIFNFSQEYKTPIFGTVRWSEILKRNRTIAIVVVKNISRANDYKTQAEANSKNIYWSIITRSKYNELSSWGLKENEIPALIIGNPTKTKFAIIKNITPDSMIDIANSEFGKYGTVVNKKMSSVFHDFILFPGRSALFRNTMYAIFILIIIALIIGGFFLNSTPTLKFE
ncbi:hypothetical protein TVAG_118140 [Trichomonas vaginalis G3]|uniref:Uncharacterized protein n=1 Tax=Trichomonas vaginalis (strain ATCC PRA-98 / G3) TaxID=412133 RepID=A2EI01_TRIV3|nr:intramolecular oxidoreductase activity, transposing S-S bonds [Trichomonas vaginalis G3]EAY07733.1 hypothetical protein TVAG_118140 [Trichomonas vaginalis G3]KAI5552576.1 intramolecular oxidoreductase activity, transposing S-S bonds [Trichomonas vaginalis G3]|eukprot:XP_001319956.1 hypothetical protein [Trichomonas vaginalis G3]